LREYCGQYIGFEGNVFNPDKIQQISERGALLERKRLGLIPREWEKVLSIDPGYSSSRYAMVVTTIEPESGVIEVLYAKEVQNADFNEMLDEIMRIWNNYNLFKIYVDGSAVETIRSIKNAIGEYSGDWNALIKRYESKGWDPADYMKVLPINFRVEAREMLAHLKRLIDSDVLAISPTSFQSLLISLRTAFAVEGVLKKQTGAHNDLLDALLMCGQHYIIAPISA
jgi:hypothetical protein